MLKRQQSVGKIDPAAVVAGIKQRLRDLADEVANLPPLVLADVLSALTVVLEADMETKETTFAFHLPVWMLIRDVKTPLSQLCTRTSREFSTGSHTHHDPSLFITLGEGICRFAYQHRNAVSCRCRRSGRPAAA